MTEDQLRDRLHATAAHIDRSQAPLGAIRVAGRTIARRRAAARVVIGVATTAAAVTAFALIAPASVPSTDDVPPATTSPSLEPEPEPCPAGLVAVGDPRQPTCADVFPESGTAERPRPGELKRQFANQLPLAGPEQRQAVDDDRVTDAEYRAGFEGYRTCLAERGHELGAVVHNGIAFNFVVTDDAVRSGADKACYDRHWWILDMVWQEQYADEIFSRDTLTHANICLVLSGAKAAQSLDQAARLLQEAGLREEECAGLLPGQIEATSD